MKTKPTLWINVISAADNNVVLTGVDGLEELGRDFRRRTWQEGIVCGLLAGMAGGIAVGYGAPWWVGIVIGFLAVGAMIGGFVVGQSYGEYGVFRQLANATTNVRVQASEEGADPDAPPAQT